MRFEHERKFLLFLASVRLCNEATSSLDRLLSFSLLVYENHQRCQVLLQTSRLSSCFKHHSSFVIFMDIPFLNSMFKKCLKRMWEKMEEIEWSRMINKRIGETKNPFHSVIVRRGFGRTILQKAKAPEKKDCQTMKTIYFINSLAFPMFQLCFYALWCNKGKIEENNETQILLFILPSILCSILLSHLK